MEETKMHPFKTMAKSSCNKRMTGDHQITRICEKKGPRKRDDPIFIRNLVIPSTLTSERRCEEGSYFPHSLNL